MRILGIDPGLGKVGFGLLQVLPEQAGRFQAVSEFGPSQWGIIATSKDKSDGQRLQEIHDDFQALLSHLKPDVLVVERLFFFRNNTTIIPVAQARGVILMLGHRFSLPLFEYTPLQVKKAITGYGKAEKAEVQNALIDLLQLPKKPTPDDAADGLALALCHYNYHARFEPQRATVFID